MYTSNSKNVIGDPNLPHINFQGKITVSTLITLQKKADPESVLSINDETINRYNISEEMSSHQNLAEVVDKT